MEIGNPIWPPRHLILLINTNACPLLVPLQVKTTMYKHVPNVSFISSRGIGLSLVSGVLYGQIFTASTYVQDKTTGASQNGKY